MTESRRTLRRRRRGWAIASATAGAMLVVTVLVSRDPESRPCRGTLLPAYVRPDAIIALAEQSRRPRVVIVNPESGPGIRPSGSYREAVRAAQESGARVLGYVPTAYGERDRLQAEADIDRYESWYGTDGVFLDEAAPGKEQLPYYRALSRRVRSSGERFVVLNPGLVPVRGYFDVADVVVTFEGPYSSYAGKLAQMPAWVRALPPRRVAHLIYAASAAQAEQAIRMRSGAGYLYATSGSLPNPWGTLAPYLREQEELLETCGRP